MAARDAVTLRHDPHGSGRRVTRIALPAQRRNAETPTGEPLPWARPPPVPRPAATVRIVAPGQRAISRDVPSPVAPPRWVGLEKPSRIADCPASPCHVAPILFGLDKFADCSSTGRPRSRQPSPQPCQARRSRSCSPSGSSRSSPAPSSRSARASAAPSSPPSPTPACPAGSRDERDRRRPPVDAPTAGSRDPSRDRPVDLERAAGAVVDLLDTSPLVPGGAPARSAGARAGSGSQ